jgi:hypothetical protein
MILFQEGRYMAWDSRFRAASAARSWTAKGDAAPKRMVDAMTVAQARRTSPEPFLRRHYRDVVVDRRGGISVPQTLRIDFLDDHWVACDWGGGPIGDNIALVRWLQPALGFPEAILALTGVAAEFPVAHRQQPVKAAALPRLPPEAPRQRGVAYLAGRGVSAETIAAAEAAGALRHVGNGVVFLGRDHLSTSKTVRAATIRYFEPQTTPDGDVLTKRDLANSDKAFPFLLPGETSRVVVVEGAINALAVRDLALRSGLAPPTAIGTGGVGIRSWVRINEALKAVLAAADVVEVWGENEVGANGRPDPIKQTRTDELRRKLQDAMAELRAGELPEVVYPPEGVKDAAEWNVSAAGMAVGLPRP